jgi:uncharacterized membrane protein
MICLAFLNPMLLWALPLAAVPIIIHILNRRRFQKVPWAAMDFLIKAMKRNRKRLRMEQWLVLLLRVLAVLLLVALVSRPQLGGSNLLGSRTHHVIVIDDSASMMQRSGSADIFVKAQNRIKLLADDLAVRREGDLCSLVKSSDPSDPIAWAERVGSEFGRRAGTLVKQIKVSDRASDLGGALEAVVARAHEVQGADRTDYYLIGDRRSWDWVTPDDKPRPSMIAGLAAMQADKEHVTVITVGGEQGNLSIVDVKLQDRLAIAAVPVSFGVDIKNFGLDPTAAIKVSIEVDGKSRITQDVPALAPGQRVTVPIGHTFHEAGPHRIDAKLDMSESFPFDDSRTLAIHVREKSRVLLVDGQPDEGEGEVFFLQASYDLPNSGIETQVVTEIGFDETNLDAFDLVWLCNVQAPTPAAVERLDEFVAAGGGLAITCGSLTDASRYNELMWRDGEGLLPLPIGDISGDPDRPEHAFLVNQDHPICDGVSELFELVLGNWIQVKRWLQLIEPESHNASIVARVGDEDGSPMLVTRSHGVGGEVALLSTTADRFWSNLPSTDLFLVLTHQLHRFAARRDDPSKDNLRTDGEFVIELDPGLYRPDVTLRSLNADDERTFTAEELVGNADGETAQPVADTASSETADQKTLAVSVSMAELQARGAYEIVLERHDGVPEKRMLSRNAPPSESHLVGFGEPAFRKIYPNAVHNMVTFVRDEGGVGVSPTEGEAWPLLAALLLAGLLAESLFAWRFGRR